MDDDAEITMKKFLDGNIKDPVNDVLASIKDPSRKTEMEKNALTSARSYWEDALRLPDQAYDIVILGRRRIEEISTQIEGLENQGKL